MSTSKDPVCGMDVDEKEARKKRLTISKDGKEYFFCSNDCKNKFGKKEPWYRSQAFGKVFPLVLAVVLIGGAIWAYIGEFMVLYMGIFFILFSLMKMLDWKGFAKAFSQYDLIAKKSKLYASAYPGIEFILGILFLIGFFYNDSFIIGAAWITIFIMGVGSIGVGKNIFSKNKVQCACLGTKINVPLTKVTFLEDIIMVLMAISLVIG